MNIEYLFKEVIPQRRKEIENGDNLATAQPIYVVLDLIEKVAFGHVEISSNTNLAEKDPEEGYVDMDPEIETEDREFNESDEGMIIPAPITRFWIDRPIAFFLTSLAAHNYKKYQAHNLTDPYVYVFHSGYGNRQMDNLLNNDHSMSYQYYMQTGYIGNSMLFWRIKDAGYTANVNQAKKFRKEEAENIIRETHGKDLKMWPVNYINQFIRPHVDSPNIDRKYAITEDDVVAKK